MKLRGPGEFFGTRQSGLPALRIANILRDSEILEAARREAQAMVGRPLSIQAMASWFLDLRVAVQGQQYVVLSGQP